MAGQIRLFIAIAIPISRRLVSDSEPRHAGGDNSLTGVLSTLRAFGHPVKMVALETVHVTLKFVGDVSRELVPGIAEAVELVAATECPFTLQLEGLGAFPNRERPSVVWVGLKNAEACSRMAADLETRLVEFGIPVESRPFHPHLTLARIKGRPPHDLFRLLEEEQSTPFGSESISSLELIRSDLKSNGPEYSTLVKAMLSGKPQ